MLIQFRFKNYKSFKDEAILDLTATKITENLENVVQIGNEKVLKLAAIYGANASGKSCVFDAFEYMSYYVMKSFSFDDEKHNRQKEQLPPVPFNFSDETKKMPSEFEVYFSITDKKGNVKFYNYGFSVDANKVYEEWLNTKSASSRKYKNIFYREHQRIEFNNSNSKQTEFLINSALSEQGLIVSLGAKLRIGIFQDVRNWFIKNETLNYASLTQNIYLYRNMPENFATDKIVQNNVIEYFSSFDKSIVGFEVAENQKNDEKEEETYSIESLHKMLDVSEKGKISFGDESAGTLKMFSLYPFLLSVIENGSILFVDELNARLHPLLVRSIILLFANKKTNPNDAQLIFTTHDTWQLSTDILRRDEVWFTEKDENGCSSLYSLSDFKNVNGVKIRKDENYEKNYLLGNYGAIPQLTQLTLKKAN